ncbi:MAG: hypothetical protein R2810_04110 [Flavobacteriales bacterium]
MDDCLGVPGGSALPGIDCDDGDPNTTLVRPALPGQDCDDGDPNTSGETWDANCNCTGGLVDDCLGVPGGSALPGTACDDGDIEHGGR